MVVLDNGNVGIGTTNPQKTLHVAGSVVLGNATGSVNIGLSAPGDVLNVTKTATLSSTNPIPGTVLSNQLFYNKLGINFC